MGARKATFKTVCLYIKEGHPVEASRKSWPKGAQIFYNEETGWFLYWETPESIPVHYQPTIEDMITRDWCFYY